MIIAFQVVIHKEARIDRPLQRGAYFDGSFARALQQGVNAEIIAGFPECVQGDMSRAAHNTGNFSVWMQAGFACFGSNCQAKEAGLRQPGGAGGRGLFEAAQPLQN